MIGKAIHRILKEKIEDLSDGQIYPIIVPQNSKHQIGSDSSYPQVVYHQFIDYENSKDVEPNIILCMLNIQVVSDKYSTVNLLSNEIKNTIDHYVDKSEFGLFGIKAFTENGKINNFIGNINIQNIFYIEEEDHYYDDLFLYSRSISFNVYYYESIDKLSYDGKYDSPMFYHLDFTTNKFSEKPSSTSGSYAGYPSATDNVKYAYNKIGEVKSKFQSFTSGPSDDVWERYWLGGVGSSSWTNMPQWKIAPDPIGGEGSLYITNYKNLTTRIKSGTGGSNSNLKIPYGALLVFVYRPVTQDNTDSNYLLGRSSNNDSIDGEAGLVIIHDKKAAGIDIKFNTGGSFVNSNMTNRTVTIATSTDSTNYFNAEYHFLAISLGSANHWLNSEGVNYKGWFEYFNSNYNPKLSSGQIVKNNSFDGFTTPIYGQGVNICSIGSFTDNVPGFKVYECMILLPNGPKSHGGAYSDSPFIMPTDITYNNIKNYIYNKYQNLL